MSVYSIRSTRVPVFSFFKNYIECGVKFFFFYKTERSKFVRYGYKNWKLEMGANSIQSAMRES